MKTVFIRVLETAAKPEALKRLAASSSPAGRFTQSCDEFRNLPNTPFAYWVSSRIRRVFVDSESLEDLGVAAKQGLATADDFRFVRTWWEVPAENDYWKTFAKGGPLSSYYADIPEKVAWGVGGREISANLNAIGEIRSNIWMLKATARECFLRPGLTWPVRASRFSPRALPADAIFSHRGYSAFCDPEQLEILWTVFNSSTFDFLFKLCLGRFGFPEFLVGLVPKLPAPPRKELLNREALRRLPRRGWSLQRTLDSPVEVSHAFALPAILQVEGSSLRESVSAWSARVSAAQTELGRVQNEIDELCFELYGISEEDRLVIAKGFADAGGDGLGEGDESDVDTEADDEGELVELDPVALAAGLVSWAVGVGVGRFDVRLATRERAWPQEPDPFDPLPVCSPGMLTGENGLPLVEPPPDYPVSLSSILVDDPGHMLDLTQRVRSVFQVVFGEAADAWWSDVGGALGRRDGEVGGWLAKGFFDHHLKAYSRSRRKAPVLWPIGTKSGSYLVWLYAHRVSADSLFQALHDVVAPKVAVEDRELSQLRQTAGTNPSASQRKAIEAQERFVAELRELRDELEAVAPLWAPDLNDGIVVVLAPLWRLFAHHRVWSNELKKHWAKLAKGDYDWAQLAMDLWPERVVRKCAEDRSLAIAHGLEDVFWVQDPENADKWHPRREPTIAIDQLIAQRHNPAAAAALQRIST